MLHRTNPISICRACAGTLLAMTVLTGWACADPVVIDFNNLQTGEVVTNQFGPLGVYFAIENNNASHPDKGIVFDSNNPTGGDFDLGGPFGGGNLQGSDLGNLLIIAEDDVDANGDGLIDDPDDEAGGGVIKIQFDNLLESFSFTHVDLDSNPGQYSVTFRKAGGTLAEYTFGDLAAMDPTLDFGDNHANLMPTLGSDVIGDHFDEVWISFSGSGGLGSIAFTETQHAPEAGTLVLFVLGGCFMVRFNPRG